VKSKATEGSGGLALDAVSQDAYFLDVEFDDVAMLEVPAEFKSAAIADGA
jgi:hypothetical protein